jgi:type IV pilus assembly protein PilM
MTFLHRLRRILEDPPPEFILEFSEAGIAWAHRGQTLQTGFQPLDPGVLSVSPVRDNVLLPEAMQDAVLKLVPAVGHKRRRPCALILPDYCGRVTVLDFDSFPSEPQEQASLVRFRVKKSVPFDLDAASVSFHVQPHPGGGKKRDVIVAVVSLEILARYEAPLRMAGLHYGLVTLSTLAALNLVQSPTLDVTAKLTGNVLSVAVTEQNTLRIYRCVELDVVTAETVLGILFPTYAYIEDEYKKKPERLLLCGFGAFGEFAAPQLEHDLGSPVEALRSPLGTPTPFNGGLLGYLSSVGLDSRESAA